jgi:hypothetical protein
MGADIHFGSITLARRRRLQVATTGVVERAAAVGQLDPRTGCARRPSGQAEHASNEERAGLGW